MTLSVTTFGPEDTSAPTLLAVHGITANGLAWKVTAGFLPRWRLIAPDLRGRGRSGSLPGPFGLSRHAEDLAELLDAMGVERAVVAGHSMGGFVAVALAALRPELITRLVLVDGGLPLELPPGATAIDPAAIAARLGPAAARLERQFTDEAAYVDLWREHPAFAGEWRPEIEDYARYDLTGTAPRLRASASAEAMFADGAELYGPDWYLAALRGIRAPVDVLRAPRGLLDDEPLYPPGALESFSRLVPQLRVTEVPGVNHYTILFSDRGAQCVADAIDPTRLSETKEFT
jgi:pimeloyl-ACP methyl ester carboxylesterase